MNIYISKCTAHLGGDWTLTGVTQCAMDSMAVALQQIKPECEGRLLVDCRDVIAIDSTGQELLYVWMQCARLRGFEPELLNPPPKLRHSFQSFGLHCRDTSPNTTGLNNAAKSHKIKEIPT
jgi:ABC-type transporter Mla MlaB component